MTAYKQLVVLAAAGVLGFSTQAAAQKCSATGSNVECSGVFSFGSGNSGVALLKVTAKETGTPDFGRSISVRVCSNDSIGFGREFIAVVARTATPKDVVRCTTVNGNTCVARPVQKSPTSSSDSILVTLLGVGGATNGRFTIRRDGWDEMQVAVFDTSFATVTMPGTPCP